MAQFVMECWNPSCKKKFHAGDDLPAHHDHKCPRCGMMARRWINTPWDKARGTPYWLIAVKRVGRLGRERMTFWLRHGKITANRNSYAKEYISRGVPSFKF